jgi:hypothetical protein
MTMMSLSSIFACETRDNSLFGPVLGIIDV